jgi:hypothetical protein
LRCSSCERRFGAGHAFLQASDLLERFHGADCQNFGLAVRHQCVALLQRQGMQVAAAVEADLH